MIFKRPHRDQKPIGRKVEFSNPLKNSSKKHFWSEGTGNLGYLTSEQIQILKQLKGRQKKANSYYYKDSCRKLHVSSNNLKYENVGKQVHKQQYIENPFSHKIKTILVQQNEKLKRSQIPQVQRSRSQLNDLIKHQDNNKNAYTKLRIQRAQTIGTQDVRQKLRRLQNVNKVKTIGIQRPNNPQQNSELEQKYGNLISQQQNYQDFIGNKDGSRNVGIQLENQRPLYSLQVNKSKQKQIQRRAIQDIPTKMENQSKQNHFNSSKNEFLVQGYEKNDHKYQRGILQNSDHLYKSKKFFQPKTYLRNKLRRDHSPTFCNSFGYPLRYYRHV